MAKQIIILNVSTQSQNGLIGVRYLLWLTTASPVVIPGGASQWLGASAAENAAIAAGTTIEEGYSLQLPFNLSKVQLEALLNLHYTARQNEFTAQPQPGVVFGVFYDPALTPAWSS